MKNSIGLLCLVVVATTLFHECHSQHNSSPSSQQQHTYEIKDNKIIAKVDVKDKLASHADPADHKKQGSLSDRCSPTTELTHFAINRLCSAPCRRGPETAPAAPGH